MSNSIADVLAAKNYDEPPEVVLIKTFIDQNYKAECQVIVNPNQIIIGLRGASLAGTVRMRLHELQALCQTKKRLVIRIVS